MGSHHRQRTLVVEALVSLVLKFETTIKNGSSEIFSN